MSEDAAVYKTKETAVVKKEDYWSSIPIDPATLIPEPRNLAEMWFCARFFASTGMVPPQFAEIIERPGPNGEIIYDEVGAKRLLCAWMMGRQTGMQLWSAMKSIAVINNRASIFGAGAIGLVRSKGKLEWLKEGLEGEDKTRYAWCEVKRRGEPLEITYKKTFSWEQAKAAGLLEDAKKKHTWGKYLDDMLLSKARARALSVAFADILEGLSIAEDVSDYEENVIRSGGKQAPPSAFDFMGAQSEPIIVKASAQPATEPEPEPPATEKKPDKLDGFLAKTRLTDEQRGLVDTFIKEVSDKAQLAVEEVRDSATKQFKSFLTRFSEYLYNEHQGMALNVEEALSGNVKEPPTKEPPTKEPPTKEPPTKEPPKANAEEDPLAEISPHNWWLKRENWINSRGMGFKHRITENLLDLTAMPDAWVYEEIYKKWKGSKDVKKMGDFPLMTKVLRHCVDNKIDFSETQGTDEPPDEPSDEPPLGEPPPEDKQRWSDNLGQGQEPDHSIIPDTIDELRARVAEEYAWDDERVMNACAVLNINAVFKTIEEGQELLGAIRDSYAAEV